MSLDVLFVIDILKINKLLDKMCFMFTRTNNDGLNDIKMFSDEHRSFIVFIFQMVHLVSNPKH